MTTPIVDNGDMSEAWERFFRDFQASGVIADHPIAPLPKSFTLPLPGDCTIREALHPSPRPGMEK